MWTGIFEMGRGVGSIRPEGDVVEYSTGEAGNIGLVGDVTEDRLEKTCVDCRIY